jgi:FkbM family methyltransferase
MLESLLPDMPSNLAKKTEIATARQNAGAEILEFLNGHRKLFHPSWPNHVVRVLWCIKRGALSWRDFFPLILPLRFYPAKKLYLPKYYEVLQKELMRELVPLASSGTFSLFGKPFWPSADYSDTFSLVAQIILWDQYDAKRFLKKNSVVIDAGANLGIFSIWAARLAPEGRVFAFEPVKDTLALLKRNAGPYGNVVCVGAGLGDKPKEAIILDRGVGASTSVMQDSPFLQRSENSERDRDGRLEKVTIVTIDQFVAENHISRVDFIKIDTEGYEAKVLQGARKTIERYKPVIAMSAYHNPDDKRDLPRILKEIYPEYVCELHQECEEDFICHAKL